MTPCHIHVYCTGADSIPILICLRLIFKINKTANNDYYFWLLCAEILCFGATFFSKMYEVFAHFYFHYCFDV